MRAILAALLLCVLTQHPALANGRYAHRALELRAYGRPSAWCGWWMRFNNPHGADPGAAFNLAHNWARWGERAFAAAVNVVVVWPHHVGKIVGGCNGNVCTIESGNDGHAVRTRPRSIAGAIALRE